MINLNDIIFKSAFSKEEIEKENENENQIPEDAFASSAPFEENDEWDEDEDNEWDGYYCINDEDYRNFDEAKNNFLNTFPNNDIIQEKISNLNQATRNLLITLLQSLNEELTSCNEIADNYNIR